MADGVIGRDRELGAVAEFVGTLGPGLSTLIVSGEPGIGKTTVWHKAVERAQASSRLVLTARPAQTESALALTALADLLEPVVDELLPLLPMPQRRALSVALLREEPGPGGLDQRAVSAATSSILRELAINGTVVLAVDDVQWMDIASTRVLQFALRRLNQESVAVLASERVEPGVSRSSVLEHVFSSGRTTRLELGPLSLAALHDLLKERLGRSYSRRLLARIAEATGGNPLFALEIARALPEDASASVAVLPASDRLIELITTRVSALGRPSRSILLAAATLRLPSVERVKAATGLTGTEWAEAVEAVEANGLIAVEGSRLRFGHPLFATAVYGAATAADRRRLHLALASVTAEIEERARHLALGATGPDEAIAAELERAAEHARARGGHESAVALAEWARALTPEARRADIERRTVLAAEYRFHSGEPETAREQLEALLRDAPPGRGRADALRLLGEIRYHQESFPDAIPLFEEALAYVGDDPHTAAGIELRLALCLRCLDQYDQAEVHTRRAVQLSEEAADSGLLAEAVAVMTRLDVVLGRGLDEAKLSRALELEDRNRQVAMQLRPSKIAGDVLLYVGELERSVALLERERERVLERGEENDLPFVLSHLTWAECWRGRLAKAEAHALESLEVASRLGGPSVQSMALTFAAVAAAYRGEADKAHRWAEEGLTLAHQAGWHTAVVWGNWALGVLAISLGDAHGADSALGPLTTVVEGEDLGDPVRTMYLSDEIEALISLGDLDRAAHLVDMLEPAAERLGRRWALAQAGRCRALLLAAGGDLEAAGNVAEQALAVAETIEHRLELARTCLVAGQIQRRRRRKAAARQLVSRSVEIFEDAGATIWADRARRELQRASGLHAGPGLTASERRVATLAATGLTNREVAARLFISGKTVEAHLASTYRKLGIRSRAELGAQLGTPGPSLRD